MTDPVMSLFRKEVEENRKTRLQGEILLHRPVHIYSVAVLIFLSIASLAIWVVTSRYTRSESARGILVASGDYAKIVGLRPGIITKISVEENEWVSKGQELATIQIEQKYSRDGRVTEDQMLALEAQRQFALTQLRAGDLKGRGQREALSRSIALAKQQVTDIDFQIGVQQQLIEEYSAELTKHEGLANNGYVTLSDLANRRQEILRLKQELAKLRQQKTANLASIDEYKAGITQSKIDQRIGVATIKSADQSLLLQKAQVRGQQSYVISAPIEGEIAGVQAGLGRTVDPTIPLMTIMPKKAVVHADLYAPSRAAGFVKAGDEVLLRYDSFPYERFGSFRGRVTLVSHVALDPRQIDAPLKIDEPVYRITVVPEKQSITGYGSPVRLQPGMTLSGAIILERRSFFEWLMEPINAVIKRDQ